MKDTVLIDSWASWFGPCIAAFPTLKGMRNNFGSEGFEVVCISIDDAFENWEESSTRHELPWIDLGEMTGYNATSAIDYGVSFLPKTYLIDTKGCILQKEIETEQLKDFVTARYNQQSKYKASVAVGGDLLDRIGNESRSTLNDS